MPEYDVPPLSEKEVAKQISDFLEWHGWRRFRNSSGVSTNQAGATFRYGEKGMCDLLFIRYVDKQPPWALVLWVETKRLRGKTAPDQLKWQNDERKRGALVVQANNFYDFSEWYQETLGWIHSSDGPPLPGNLHLF